eukprot:1176785-Prorocentrum_minimum.AAC.3
MSSSDFRRSTAPLPHRFPAIGGMGGGGMGGPGMGGMGFDLSNQRGPGGPQLPGFGRGGLGNGPLGPNRHLF